MDWFSPTHPPIKKERAEREREVGGRRQGLARQRRRPRRHVKPAAMETSARRAPDTVAPGASIAGPWLNVSAQYGQFDLSLEVGKRFI